MTVEQNIDMLEKYQLEGGVEKELETFYSTIYHILDI